MTSENEFVRKLVTRFPVLPPVKIGIGDDGAVLKCSSDQDIVVVTDLLLDGVHFDLNVTDIQLAGRKAVAVNISDLAAMACLPTAAFVSLAIPRGIENSSSSFLDRLYLGIEELTNEFSFCLAGGDTNSWNGPFAINVCLTGKPISISPVLRSGAKLGDSLFVSGPLGGSLRYGRHLTFRPRIDAAQWLVNNVQLNCMMDISDGLSMDLHRMMEASGTGAELKAALIPIHADVPDTDVFSDRLAAAVGDGEDFELLFSVTQSDAATIRSTARLSGMNFFEIGTVTSGPGIFLQNDDGHLRPLLVSGWQHEL